jgi:hypothetical protein
MPYNTRRIKTDFDGKPIPQYVDVDGDSYEPQHGMAGGATVHILGTIVHESWEATATVTKNLAKPCTAVSVANDGTVDVFINVHDFTIKVRPEETYYANFEPFTSLTITTTDGLYRAEALR